MSANYSTICNADTYLILICKFIEKSLRQITSNFTQIPKNSNLASQLSAATKSYVLESFAPKEEILREFGNHFFDFDVTCQSSHFISFLNCVSKQYLNMRLGNFAKTFRKEFLVKNADRRNKIHRTIVFGHY